MAMVIEIEEAVVHYLRTLATLRAVIGDAVYGDIADPKAPKRRVHVEKQSDETYETLDEGLSGYDQPRVDIVCVAPTRKEANNIAKLIRGKVGATALQSFTGFMGPANKRLYIQHCDVTDATSEHDNPVDGGERGDFKTRLSAQFYFNESEAEG